jgi:soluble P-type ATPase
MKPVRFGAERIYLDIYRRNEESWQCTCLVEKVTRRGIGRAQGYYSSVAVNDELKAYVNFTELSDQCDDTNPVILSSALSSIIADMISLNIPGRGMYELEHLVMDVNGTIAIDGQLIEGLAKKIGALRDRLTIHLLTADTHGKQAVIDQQLGLTAVRIAQGGESLQKAEYVSKLGCEKVVAIGQGANDAEMLELARLGICVMSAEGVAKETLLAADLILPNIIHALDLLENPMRIVASLRK